MTRSRYIYFAPVGIPALHPTVSSTFTHREILVLVFSMGLRPPPGHIHLVLFDRKPNPFYLEIPLRIIREVCLHPPKFLRYLGRCVLGAEGSLQHSRGDLVDLGGQLVDRDTYYYRLPAQQDVLSHAVDLEVIKLRSKVSTQKTTRGNFRRKLAMRDGEQCVWTGLPSDAMYIIPWSKGDEWFQRIIENRPHGDEQKLDTLKSINDIRNGIMGAKILHTPFFDNRAVVILKTPNPILEMSDIPDRPVDFPPPHGSTYPLTSRYTLHWLAAGVQSPRIFSRPILPSNIDAAFVSHHKPGPSDLLLHYNYGAAAVKHWGRNIRKKEKRR
ncbi:hypothetical protein HD554DRAFT_2315664 [Boletus coccyginus]|nr:hypothetical protein HD554DRAFT_2315664 [Boletus coccyginus]